MFFSFSFTLTAFYLMDEWVDATIYGNIEKKTISSDKDEPNEQKIVILGSSRVMMLDAVYIDNYVMKKGYNVDIYNGGISGGGPANVLPLIDDWISEKAELPLLWI